MSAPTGQVEIQESRPDVQAPSGEISFNESLWSISDTGEIVANTVDITSQTEQLLSEPDWVSNLLAEYGLDHADPTAIKNSKLDLVDGQSGTWDSASGSYTPTWDIAFSNQDIFFILTFDITDPLDTNYTLSGLNKEILLQFDRSGIDLEQLINDPASTDAIEVNSDNGAGILIAFGRELQSQRGLGDQPITVSLNNGDVVVPFSDAQLDAAMEVIGNYAFIAAPTIGLVDDVGNIKGSLSFGSVTDDNTPTIRLNLAGTNAQEGDVVELFNGSNRFGQPHVITTAEITSGVVIIELSPPAIQTVLADGSYDLSGRVSSQKGAKSTSFSFVVDTKPPAPPQIDPVTGDNIVRIDEKASGITLRGRSEPGSTVSVKWLPLSSISDETITPSRTDTTLSRNDGSWEIRLEPGLIPTSGNYKLEVLATDEAGNISTPTSIAKVIVDAGNLAPTALNLDAGAGITRTPSPGDEIARLTGTDPDSDTLTYYRGAGSDFDNRFFSINPNSGAISIRNDLNDFELAELTDILTGKQSLSISATVWDDGTPSLSFSRLIQIPVVIEGNIAPAVSTAQVKLSSVNENTAAASISGKAVAELVAGAFNDPGDILGGVALVGNQSTGIQGNWQYRIAKTNNWLNVPELSDTNPFLLLPSDQLRFVPARNYSGDPGQLSLRLLDDSRIWSSGRLPSGEVLATGGANAASATTLAVGITITDTPSSPNNLRLEYLNGLNGVPENPAIFAKLTGNDPDTAINNLRYTLENTNPPDLIDYFSLDPKTGDLSVREKLSNVSSVTFTIKVDDQSKADPLIRSFTLGVLTGENTAPRAKVSEVSLAPITKNSPLGGSVVEDAEAKGGAVHELFGGGDVFSDTPGTSFKGVAVVANNATPVEGVWQYTNGSNTFINLPAVSEATPLLITGTNLIRFLPKPGFTGKPGALSIRLLDDSKSHTTGLTKPSDPLVVGGSGSASTELVTLVTTVRTSLAPTRIRLIDSIFPTNVDDIIATVVVEDMDSLASELSLTGDDKDLLTLEGSEIKLNSALNSSKTRLNFSVTATDEDSNSLTQAFTLISNSAPALDTTAEAQDRPRHDWAPIDDLTRLPRQVYLDEIDQGSDLATENGKTISYLFENRMQPAGIDDLFPNFTGVAIVANAAATDPRAGRWEYQLVGGVFKPLPTVSELSPLLLPTDARLRFRPNQQFKGIPPSLSVRLLDNSITIPADGRLPAGSSLIAGGSGAASAELLELLTNIKKPENGQAPQTVSFAAAREILVDVADPTTAMVAGGSLLGRFIAFDPDTGAADLNFSHNLDPNKYDIVNGNELRVKAGVQVSQQELESLRLIVTVNDGKNSLSSTTPFSIPRARFTATADTLARTESVVLPLIAKESNENLKQALQLSVTGFNGSFSVDTAGVLEEDDIKALRDLGLDLGKQDSKEIEIVPLAPLLDFTVNASGSGEVIRFEFELPSGLTYSELKQIRYLKLLANGTYEFFSYEPDEFGVYTGARLEQRQGNEFVAVEDEAGFAKGQPTFLAVYVQDNARGDSDLNLGIVRDPGLPMLLTSVAVPTNGVTQQTPSGPGRDSSPAATKPASQPTTPTDPVTPDSASEPSVNPAPSTVSKTVLDLLGVNPASITFDVTGSNEAEQFTVTPAQIPEAGSINLSLGGGDDVLRLTKKARSADIVVDAGDGNDSIRTRRGSDVVIAGSGDDQIQASTSTRRRGRKEAEIDRLAGGEGSDNFMLGLERRSLYLDIKGRGQSSYALISDLGQGDQITLSRNDKNSYKLKAKQHPSYPDVEGYGLYMKNDMVAFIVLDDSLADKELSLDDRSMFTYRKG